jgi:hypothetical protein
MLANFQHTSWKLGKEAKTKFRAASFLDEKALVFWLCQVSAASLSLWTTRTGPSWLVLISQLCDSNISTTEFLEAYGLTGIH